MRTDTRHPDDEVNTEAEAIAYLLKDGNLPVPCSRYGRDAAECAPIAWRAACLVSDGEPIHIRDLDYAMGLVVNDYDDIAYLLDGTYGV